MTTLNPARGHRPRFRRRRLPAARSDRHRRYRGGGSPLSPPRDRPGTLAETRRRRVPDPRAKSSQRRLPPAPCASPCNPRSICTAERAARPSPNPPPASRPDNSSSPHRTGPWRNPALGAVARPLGSPRRTPVRLPGIRSRKERPAPGADRGRPRPEAIANPTPAAARRSPPPRTATPAESGIPAKQGAVFCFPGINAYLWPRKRLGGPPVERRTE